jgi:hypothetical protein
VTGYGAASPNEEIDVRDKELSDELPKNNAVEAWSRLNTENENSFDSSGASAAGLYSSDAMPPGTAMSDPAMAWPREPLGSGWLLKSIPSMNWQYAIEGAAIATIIIGKNLAIERGMSRSGFAYPVGRESESSPFFVKTNT